MLSALVVFYCSFWPLQTTCEVELDQCIDSIVRERLDIGLMDYSEEMGIEAFNQCIGVTK